LFPDFFFLNCYFFSFQDFHVKRSQ
jgi:hypothetical protein